MKLEKCECGGEMKFCEVGLENHGYLYCIKCGKIFPSQIKATIGKAWNALRQAEEMVEGWKKEVNKNRKYNAQSVYEDGCAVIPEEELDELLEWLKGKK